jgi:endonuclease YncB( thermonuclease family)
VNCSKVCAWLSGLLLLAAAPSSAADTVVVKDGDTIALGGTTFRLDGIDAPEFDQVCLDEAGTVWACGVAARNRLAEFIGKRTVRCDDKGPDPAYPRGASAFAALRASPRP